MGKQFPSENVLQEMLLVGCLVCCKHLKMVAVDIIIAVTSTFASDSQAPFGKGGQGWTEAVCGDSRWMGVLLMPLPDAPPIPSPHYLHEYS